MKSRIVILTAALLLAGLSAQAQTGTWTAVGSSGVIDETGLPHAFTQTRLGFGAGSSSGSIVARYNVTNTWGGGNDDSPPWDTLEVGARNTSSFATVTAALYEVDPCTGARTLVCQVTNDTAGSQGACETCSFSSSTFDFSSDLYYIEVTITRSPGTGLPELTTLRIF